MKKITFLLVLGFFFDFNDICGQNNWPRFPTDSEIEQAVQDYFDNPNADIRIGTEEILAENGTRRDVSVIEIELEYKPEQ